MPAAWFFAGLALLSIGGAALVAYSTVWGAGLISDSFQYLAAAQSFAARGAFTFPGGDGASAPLTQYPPGYSTLLAVFILAGVDGLVAMRWVNAALFAVNLFLVGLSVRRVSASAWFGLAGGGLALLAAPLVETHAWALSEPLYLALSLGALFCLDRYLERRRWSWLAAACLLLAAAALTRYVGVSLAAVAVAGALWLGRVSWRKKLVDAGWLAVAGLAPIAAWTLHSLALTGLVNNRSLAWNPLTPKNLLSAANTVLTWLLPPPLVDGREKLLVFLGLGALAILAGIILLLRRRAANPLGKALPTLPQPGLLQLHALYLPCYLSVVMASKLFFDANIGFSARMLIPMQVSLLILLGGLAAWLWSTGMLAPRAVAGAMLAGLLLYYAAGTVVAAPRWHRQGLGVARKSWHLSATVRSLRSLEVPRIYTNSPSTLYLWSGRPGYNILDFESYLAGQADEPAALVVFSHIPPNARLLRLVQGLETVQSDRIATIYLFTP